MVKSEVANVGVIPDKPRIQLKDDAPVSRRERKLKRNKLRRKTKRGSQGVPTITPAENPTTTTTVNSHTTTTPTKPATTTTTPTATKTTTTTSNLKSSTTPTAINRTTTRIKSPPLPLAKTLQEVIDDLTKNREAEVEKAIADAHAREEAAKAANKPFTFFEMDDSDESESDSDSE
ncbi:hypothetical protein EDD37DRAFT_301 [Exophiala viscosa]|uniref:Uncharacterized protein n=1 Tax=Exophiala viscosa TaxID=2486360 RepID=A0AAN6I822_9EURO|nr:hypothetical protein EDD36DRAFT_423929 [Exophiala viscosa]KAI1628345.1 hypothetical protein EDD37DRAFT_301 [Exophiala viscosa]